MDATDQCAQFYILLEAHTLSQSIIVILITTKRYLVRAEPLLYHLDSANHLTSFRWHPVVMVRGVLNTPVIP